MDPEQHAAPSTAGHAVPAEWPAIVTVIVATPQSLMLAHGNLGVWDEVLTVVVTAIVLGLLGFIIFARKPEQ